jgi:hypothetical protein
MFRKSSLALQHNLATHLELQGVDINAITRLGPPALPSDPADQLVSLARVLAVMVRLTLAYGDEKVANRDIRVLWHGATGFF